jgi:hypothetical protein
VPKPKTAPAAPPASAPVVPPAKVNPPATSESPAAVSPAGAVGINPPPVPPAASLPPPANNSGAVVDTHIEAAAIPVKPATAAEQTPAPKPTPAPPTPPKAEPAVEASSSNAPPASAPAPVSAPAPTPPSSEAQTVRVDLGPSDAASPAYKDFISNLHVNGVFQGDHPRVLIGNSTYYVGDMVNSDLGVVFTGIDPVRELVLFKDSSGVTLVKKY